jgi:hypothetical protein
MLTVVLGLRMTEEIFGSDTLVAASVYRIMEAQRVAA